MPEKQQKSWLEEGGDWWRRCGVLLHKHRVHLNLKQFGNGEKDRKSTQPRPYYLAARSEGLRDLDG